MLQILLLAVGLAMDAFAVAVTLGLGLRKADWRGALVVGAYFGLFQAGMPLVGYFAGTLFADYITAFDTWLVFALLVILGGKMLLGAYKAEEGTNNAPSLVPRVMIPFALATSIDALAVGISFAFWQINLFVAVIFIGVVTFVLSAAGVKIGAHFGERYKTKATVVGGLILIGIGVWVLVEGVFL